MPKKELDETIVVKISMIGMPDEATGFGRIKVDFEAAPDHKLKMTQEAVQVAVTQATHELSYKLSDYLSSKYGE